MVRTFLDRPLPRDAVERILANARRAPSAGHSQGWAFLALEGAEETGRYWDAVGPDRADFAWPGLFDAPLLVVCIADKEIYVARYAESDKGWVDRDERRWNVPYWLVDTAMAAMLILLTAVDAGLGALFFGVADHAKLRAAFGIPERLFPIGTIAIGYPAEHDRPSPSLKRGRRPVVDVIHRGRW